MANTDIEQKVYYETQEQTQSAKKALESRIHEIDETVFLLGLYIDLHGVAVGLHDSREDNSKAVSDILDVMETIKNHVIEY